MADYGQIAANVADAAAGAAYAAVMLYIANNYVDLANDYYDLYKGQRDFYYNNFQNQGELPLTQELYGVAFYLPNYDGSNPTSSMVQFVPEYTNLLNQFQGTFTRHLAMFNCADLSPVVPAVLDIAEIHDDWYSYFFRYEEHKRDVYNARRWAQNMDTLGFGVKEGAQVERGLATSFLVFDEANGQLTSAVDSLANGYFGYTAYRKEVRDLLSAPTAVPDKIFASNFDNAPLHGPTP